MSLKKQTFSSLFWTTLDTFGIKGLTFISQLLIARWLGPEEFGLIGMIMLFVTIGLTLVDSGMSQSLIRTPAADNKDFSTVFYTNIGISVLVYLTIFLVAPLISVFYSQPILISVIRIYCLSFIIGSFSSVQIAVLTKNMQFKTLTLCNLPGAILGIAVGLIMAYNGYEVWSIVVMYLVVQTTQCVFLWFLSGWKPKFIFCKTRLKQHFEFGYKLTLSGLLNTLFENVFNILIGRFYTINYLGYYERAASLNQYPVTAISGVIGKISYPLLSKIQNDPKRISEVYKKLLKVSFYITAPLMLGAATLAEPVFLIVLGKKWIMAVPFFQILCLSSIFYPIHYLNINILKVYGRSDLFLKLEVIKKVVTIICVFIAFPFGIYALVWSSLFISVFGLFINSYYSSTLINYKTIDQLIDLLPTITVVGIMCLFMYLVQFNLSSKFLVLKTIIPSFIGIIVYLSLGKLFRLDAFVTAKQIVNLKNYK